MYMICVFPAPLVWTPWVFFGVAWCAAVAFMLFWLSLVLIFSLSESKETAENRYAEIVFGYGQHGNIPEFCHRIGEYPPASRCQQFKEYLTCTASRASQGRGRARL